MSILKQNLERVVMRQQKGEESKDLSESDCLV
jgi:hypothetical protein